MTNIFTNDRTANGNGNGRNVTQRIRVERWGQTTREQVLTFPACLRYFDNDELDEIINKIMIQAARKISEQPERALIQAVEKKETKVFGVKLYDPFWWQRWAIWLRSMPRVF